MVMRAVSASSANARYFLDLDNAMEEKELAPSVPEMYCCSLVSRL